MKKDYWADYPGLGERVRARRAVDEAALELLSDLSEMIGGQYEVQGTVERAKLWRYVFDLPAYNQAARARAWNEAVSASGTNEGANIDND
jgi:hypothetical protein